MDKSIKLIDIFNKESIQKRAKEYWDCKDEQCKVKCGNRYNHIFENKIGVSYTWNKSFDFLSKPQQTIIIKGELIRTYDALPNIDKTMIKNMLKLSIFSSKWYKLPNTDKHKLLTYVI